MSPHLTPEQIVDVMVGSGEAHASAHLVACVECATRLEAERHRLATFKESAEIASRRSEAYWARQTLLLSCRVAEMQRARAMTSMWVAAAAAVVLLAAVLVFKLELTSRRHGASPGATVAASGNNNAKAKPQDPDELLLSRLERTLDRDAPAALAPAELVTGELRRYGPPHRKPMQGAASVTNRPKTSTRGD